MISYPKVMRARAKADGKGLVTIDFPGMTFQGPVDNEVIRKLIAFTTQVVFASGKSGEAECSEKTNEGRK